MKHCWCILFLLPLLACAQSFSGSPGQPDPPLSDRHSTLAAGRPEARRANLQGGILTLIEENDDFAQNGDQHYTQGLRVSCLFSEERTPAWATRFGAQLPALGMRLESIRFGLAMGQNIYTPKNIFTAQMVMRDRPYAGWLYVGAILQRRGETTGGIPMLDNFGLDLGILGPQSMAEQAQTWWHTLGGWFLPQGWRNQLKTEPGLVLKYDRQWKLSPTQLEARWGWEFIPHAGASLGNVQTFATAGAMLRMGYNIPDDFGTQIIDSLASQSGGATSRSKEFGGYLFASADGRAVAHNAFLDGNLWRHCHTVDKEPLVGDFRVGGVLAFKHFDVSLSFVERTREFKGQSRDDRFGSVSLNAKF